MKSFIHIYVILILLVLVTIVSSGDSEAETKKFKNRQNSSELKEIDLNGSSLISQESEYTDTASDTSSDGQKKIDQIIQVFKKLPPSELETIKTMGVDITFSSKVLEGTEEATALFKRGIIEEKCLNWLFPTCRNQLSICVI